MSDHVRIEDFSVRVLDALEDTVTAYLYTAASELESIAKRNTRPVWKGDHNVKDHWAYEVDESAKVATVGNDLEAAFWEEFGTGSHALHHDGRQGWWVYIEGGSGRDGKKTKHYATKQEAEEAAEFLRKVKKLDAQVTNGVDPNRPLHRAFESKKGWLRREAERMLGEAMR